MVMLSMGPKNAKYLETREDVRVYHEGLGDCSFLVMLSVRPKNQLHCCRQGFMDIVQKYFLKSVIFLHLKLFYVLCIFIIIACTEDGVQL